MERRSWKTIRDILEADISTGRLAPGERLPTEPQLCEQYGAGRHSVRRAIAALAIEGKVRVEQGRGTFVESASLIEYAIGRRTRFRQNLLNQGLSPSREHLGDSVVAAGASVAHALQIEVGSDVYCARRLVKADDIPLAIGFSYHPLARFPDLPERRRTMESITDVYRSYGIQDYLRKNTTLHSRRPSADEAKTLMQHKDQPVIVLRSTDVDLDGRPIGHSEGAWASTRVQFSLGSLDDGIDAPAVAQTAER